MKESGLYPHIKKALLALGIEPAKIPGSTYNQGLPDFLGTMPGGKALFVEVKLKRLKGASWLLTELQKDFLCLHERAGAVCIVATYLEETKSWVLKGPNDVPMATPVRPGHSGLADAFELFLKERG